MTFSQSPKDEEIINGVFGDFVGRFLDIGAFDGQTLSNTRALALKGWGGVLVEPSPWVFPKLYELYKNERKINLVNAAVSWNSGLWQFWPDTTEHKYGSTLSPLWLSKSHIMGSLPYWVHTIDVKELLSQFGVFDFVTIDTEGHDLDILISGTADWPAVKLLCFEHSTNPPNMAEALRVMGKHGFHAHTKTDTNTYLLRQ